MSRLDCSIHPVLTQDAIDRLFKRKLFSALSFVETDPEVIAKISGLQYSKVLLVRNAILSKFSSPLTTGYKLYNEVIEQCAIISSGIQNLDKLLDGGFMTGNIYELCGTGGSGKTQICMTISINISRAFPEQTVLYVDTKNDLSSQRIFEIAEKKDVVDVGSAMNRIKICQINEATQLISLLHKLSKDLASAEGKTLGFRILIIDSISSVFFRFLGDENNRGLVLLNNLANLLHFIAVEYQIAVLVTNLVTNWTVETSELDSEESVTVQEVQTPVLGKYWSHIPDTRINVKKLDNCDNWLLVVIKSTSQAIGKTAQVTVTDAGVT